MPKNTVALNPATLSASPLYDLLTEAIQPRPIAFVSTMSAAGKPNLAPFSFFMPGGSQPPSLAFSPTVGKEGNEKDTLRNIEETGEFVVNAVVREIVEGMNAAAFAYPKDFDEWPATGLTPVPSELVQPPRVGESPVQMECRVFQVVKHGTQWGAARYVIGEIVRLHVSESLLGEDRRFMEPLRLVGRLGGTRYVDLQSLEIFELARPTAPAPSSG